MDHDDDAIETYLDELLARLRADPRMARLVLAEAETHLRDAATQLERNGMTARDAAHTAVEQFGDAALIAKQENATARVPLSAVIRQLILAIGFLCSFGFVAIGLSGLAAEGLGTIYGDRFVAGDIPGSAYTAARCADFLEYAPHARTCLDAAATHHYGEVVEYRVAAGVLGIIGFGIWLVLRRRWHRHALNAVSVMPATFVPAIGAAMFGFVGAALSLQAIGSLKFGRNSGAGQWLSAAPIALLAAAGFAVILVRRLRDQPPRGVTHAPGPS